MKKRPLIVIQLFIISVLFITLATSCKKNDENDPAIIKDGDGNTYTSVTIGTQVWLVENLKTTKLNDGTSIPLVTDNTAWNNLSAAGYCWYNNDKATYGNTYGALYNWYAVASGKLCPVGWHVPSDEEWTTLTDFLGGVNVAGGKLKETGNTHWNSPNIGATDEFGFTALPGGGRLSSGTFSYVGGWGSWWSATEVNLYFAWGWPIGNDNTTVNKSSYGKQDGWSVRCIKD